MIERLQMRVRIQLQVRLQVRLQVPRPISSPGSAPGAAIALSCESADASSRGTRQICQLLARASCGTHLLHQPFCFLRVQLCCFYDSSSVAFTTQVLLPLRTQVLLLLRFKPVEFCCRLEESEHFLIMAPFMCLLFGKNVLQAK